MGEPCGTYAGEEKFLQEFDEGKLKQRIHSVDLDVKNNIILIWFFNIYEVEHGAVNV